MKYTYVIIDHEDYQDRFDELKSKNNLSVPTYRNLNIWAGENRKINESKFSKNLLLFIHLNNNEGLLEDVWNGQEESMNCFTFIALKTIQKGGRVIFFSGGDVNLTNYNSIKEKLIAYSYFEGNQFIYKSVYQINTSLNILIANQKEITRIDEFFEDQDSDSFIIALDILIQGYLAVQAPEFVFGGESNSLDEAENFIKENYLFSDPEKAIQTKERTSFDSLVRSSDKISDSKSYWFDVLKEEIEKITCAEFQKKYNLSLKSKLLYLWKIFRGNWLGQEEVINDIPINQNDWTKLLLSVHNECKDILVGGKKKA